MVSSIGIDRMPTDFRMNYSGRNVISIAFRTAVPGVSDDVSKDYLAGVTRWLDTTAGKSYLCIDDTRGVAVWQNEATDLSADTATLALAATDATTKANAAQAAVITASVQKSTGVASASVVIPAVGTITVVNGQITAFVGA